MIWIALVFLTAVLLGGVARLLLFLRGPTARLPESELPLARQKLLALAIVGIAGSSFGFIFLYAGILRPLEAIFGVLLVVSLMEIAIRAGTPRSTS